MVWGFWLAVSVFQATPLHVRGYVKTIWTGFHIHSLKITLNGILKEGCNYKHTHTLGEERARESRKTELLEKLEKLEGKRNRAFAMWRYHGDGCEE